MSFDPRREWLSPGESDRPQEFSVPRPVYRENETFHFSNIWTYEVITPSNSQNIKRLLKNKKWDGPHKKNQFKALLNNYQFMRESHTASFPLFLGSIVESPGMVGNHAYILSKILLVFSRIDIHLVRIGAGTTLVCTSFRVHPMVNEVLHLLLHDKYASYEEASITIQDFRYSLHKRARAWTRRNIGGKFSELKAEIPLVDLLLAENYAPYLMFEGEEFYQKANVMGIADSLKTRIPVFHDMSPGLFLSRNKRDTGGPLVGRLKKPENTWSLWGNLHEVAERIKSDVTNTPWVLPEAINHEPGLFQTTIALEALVIALENSYARMRDKASSAYGSSISSRKVRKLQSEMVSISMDLSGIISDITEYATRPFAPELDFNEVTYYGYGDTLKSFPESFYEKKKNYILNRIEFLKEYDSQYTNIIASVASLSISKSAKVWAIPASAASVLAVIVAVYDKIW